MATSSRKRAGFLAALVSAMLLLTGCDFSIYSLPLPGGADTGEKPLTLTASFSNVLDLVPESAVKKDDIDIGKITKVDLVEEHGVRVAKVTMEVRRDANLPSDAVGRIGQTSLLGEKYIDLDEPAGGGNGEPMPNHGHIPLSRTGRNPEIEEVLGALSLILNGGGVAQLKTISSELNKALGGREDSARSVLHSANTLISNLDANKDKITTALRKVTNLSRELDRQMPTIDSALDQLPSALESIDKQREDLKKMLAALEKLSHTGVRVIRASKDSTVKIVRDLQPILYQLGLAGDNFTTSMNTLLTFPFVDAAVGTSPETARNLHMGDYVDLHIRLDINLANTPIPNCTTLSQLGQAMADGSPLKSLTDLLGKEGLKGLLDNLGVNKLCDSAIAAINECKKAMADSNVAQHCAALPDKLFKALQDVPKNLLDGLTGGLLSGGQTAGREVPLPGSGANRAPMRGVPNGDGTYGVTLAELSRHYDPDLVRLLAPGLDTSESGAAR